MNIGELCTRDVYIVNPNEPVISSRLGRAIWQRPQPAVTS